MANAAQVKKVEPEQPRLDANNQPYPEEDTSSESKAYARITEMVNAAKQDASANRYNKDWFYTSISGRPDYRESRLDHRHGDSHQHFVTAEELAVDIMTRASIMQHPELFPGLVQALKTHLDKEDVVKVNPDKRI